MACITAVASLSVVVAVVAAIVGVVTGSVGKCTRSQSARQWSTQSCVMRVRKASASA
jgi:hypothetical protein